MAAGVIVSVETKSGNNEFHGSAFEYHTNSRLRARNVFFTAPGTLPKNIINQYGGTVGGPIVKNRLFFFTSYEAMRQRQSSSRFATIPTARHRTGDFSDANTALYDPLTGRANGTGRQAFPNNSIPEKRIDPISRQILAMVPQPTYDRFAQNLFLSAPLQIDRDNWDAKLNYNLGSNTTLFGRFALLQYNESWTRSVEAAEEMYALSGEETGTFSIPG